MDVEQLLKLLRDRNEAGGGSRQGQGRPEVPSQAEAEEAASQEMTARRQEPVANSG